MYDKKACDSSPHKTNLYKLENESDKCLCNASMQ